MIRTALSLIALAAIDMAQRHASPQIKAAPAAKAKPAASATVNINTATVKDFATLPGIGTKIAERIIEYRQKNGPFKKVEELREAGASVLLSTTGISTSVVPKRGHERFKTTVGSRTS